MHLHSSKHKPKSKHSLLQAKMRPTLLLIAVINLCLSLAVGFHIQTTSSSKLTKFTQVEVPTLQRCQLHKSRKNNNERSAIISSSTTSINLHEVSDLAATATQSIQQSPLLIAETEEWRQYVLLFVSLGVILDVLLGNPLANLALSPMKRAAMENDENNDDREGGDNASSAMSSAKKFVANPRERVDTEQVGLAALEKARYSMELRKFLEENKTDEQKYEEIRKKIDREAAKYDSKMGE